MRDADGWHGERPLANPIDVPRLGEIYSRTAAFYDGLVAQQQAPAKLAAIEALQRRPGERLLEVGAGTGWALQRVVEASGPANAWATDVASGMLAVARQRLVVAGCPLLLADARALPFSAETFDCILNTYTFEVLPEADILAVIDECHRVLRHGGRLVAVNLTEGEGADAAMTDDWKRRYTEDPEFFGGARPLLLQSTLEARGFRPVTRRYVGPDWPSEVLLAYRA
jgi:ubiquinone/menaquinone biosynthesis C-methylase UbiE